MTHQEEQARFREAKRQRKEKLARIEAEQRLYAERRARMVFMDIDGEDLRLMLIRDDLIPEDTVSVEWVGVNGKGGIRIVCQK